MNGNVMNFVHGHILCTSVSVREILFCYELFHELCLSHLLYVFIRIMLIDELEKSTSSQQTRHT